MTIIATAGAVDANSYITLEDAQAYFANRVYTDLWDEADDQSKALITATQRLDQEGFMGKRASTTQALKWPRTGVYSDGILLASDVIPQKVKDATCELALSLGGTNVLEPPELAPFHSLSVGPVSMVMKDQVVALESLPVQVARLLRGLRIIPVVA
jgi:hypothetical protein